MVDVNTLESCLGDLENRAYNCRYNLDYSNPAHIVMTPKEDKGKMPIVVGEYHEDRDNFYYEARMEFPDKLENLDFADSFEYYTKRWYEVAHELATYLQRNSWPKDIADYE